MADYVTCSPAPSYGKLVLDNYIHTSSTLSLSAAFETGLVSERGIPHKRIFDNNN